MNKPEGQIAFREYLNEFGGILLPWELQWEKLPESAKRNWARYEGVLYAKARQDALRDACDVAMRIAEENTGFTDGPGAVAVFNALWALSQSQKAEQE